MFKYYEYPTSVGACDHICQRGVESMRVAGRAADTARGGGCATYSSSNTKTRNAGLADESGRGTDYGIQRFPKSKSKSEKNEVASSFPDRGRLTPGKE